MAKSGPPACNAANSNCRESSCAVGAVKAAMAAADAGVAEAPPAAAAAAVAAGGTTGAAPAGKFEVAA